MRRLTTRQRFAFILSIYFFVLLLILYSIFLVIFTITSSLQLKKELLAVSSDVISNHLVVNKNSLIFKKDEEGSSLKAYLITHSTSSVFLSPKGNIVRRYGFFALDATSAEKNRLYEMAKKVQVNKKFLEEDISWQGQMFKSITIPLRSDGSIVGYLITAKSLEDITNAIQLMTMLFVSLGVLTLIGSFLVGYLLVRWAFMPLRKMVGVIEKIEYDNLQSMLPLDGHPSDEFTHLSLKFNDMLTRLNDMAERQKAFTANASHELKTPLSRAISSLDLLYEDSPDKKDEIRLIRDDLFDINNLIERLLLLTRVKSEIHLEKLRSVSLHNFFKDLKNRLEHQLADKHLTLIIHSPEKAQLLIPKEYLSIIFSNIVLNAIKYSPTHRNIYITAEHVDSVMIISVKDEGIGMDKSDLERMFDRFYRGKGSTESGYGIGLSLVKQICDLYNIKIYAVSEKNLGTTITLHFPS